MAKYLAEASADAKRNSQEEQAQMLLKFILAHGILNKISNRQIDKAKSEKSGDAKLEGLTFRGCQPVAAVQANCTVVFL